MERRRKSWQKVVEESSWTTVRSIKLLKVSLKSSPATSTLTVRSDTDSALRMSAEKARGITISTAVCSSTHSPKSYEADDIGIGEY